MDTPIKSFCDQVSINGQLDLQRCGINANNQFFYSYSVAPTPKENARLLIEMSNHRVLSHLTNRTVVTRQDVTPFYSPVPQAGYPPQAAGYRHGYSNPLAGFGGAAYPSAMSTPATGGRFSASSSAGTFSTTPGAVGGTGSAYTGSPVAFTPFSSGPSVSTTPLLPSAARPVSPAVDDVKVLPGRVTLVTSSQGIEKFIERKNSEKPYGVVNSIDESGQLQRGFANAIKNMAGNNYARVIRDRQNSAKLSDRVGYGQCFTYDCNLNRWSKPSGLNNWQTIHNALVPFSNDPEFEAHLKNSVLEVFKEAVNYRIDRVIFPLLGCGQAGGTGGQLAEAISAAKRVFESGGRQAPEMILVATPSTADKKACAAFESKWNSLPVATPAPRSRGRRLKTPTGTTSSGAAATTGTTTATTTATTTTKAGSGYNTSRVLIPGQLEVVMNSDGGMFGHAREFSKKGEKCNLVNAANSYMSHGSGVAAQFSSDLGPIFNSDTKQLSPVPTGECRTTGSYSYAWDKTKGLTNCENILHVVAPNKQVITSASQYHDLFKETFVSLLRDAATKADGHTIVSCFIGCFAFHGNGHDMANALYEAYRDPRVQALSKVPKLILAGWQGSDWQVHDEFIQTFDRRNAANPVHFPSRITPARPLPAGTSGIAFPAGSGAIRKTPPSYSPSGAGLSSRSRPGSTVSTLAVSPKPLSTAKTVSHPHGALGFAKARFGNNKPFSLVNTTSGKDILSSEIAFRGGVRGGYVEHMLKEGGEDTLKRNRYYQCGPWKYKETDGYQGCQKIHTVAFPEITDREGVSDQFVTLLINASRETLLLPLDEIEELSEAALNEALDRAYSDPQVASLAKQDELPTLYFVRRAQASTVGADVASVPMAGSSRLDRSESGSRSRPSLFGGPDPARRSTSPEPVAPSAVTSSSYRLRDSTSDSDSDSDSDRDDVFSLSTEKKYTVATGVSKPRESATIAFKGGGKTIDCGICGESKPEKDFQQVKGLEVCSDCSAGYQNQGVSLSEAAKLGEEYTAINYQPLRVSRDRRDLQGYPGAGRIIVRIEAMAPDSLSDGRRLYVTHKDETHYLPDNDVGKELLRLLEVLHQEKLIYKIDKSNTTGKFAITFNFHLKTADSGGERNHGYPDMTYPSRALNEILGLASTHSLQDKLDTSKLVKLMFGGS